MEVPKTAQSGSQMPGIKLITDYWRSHSGIARIALVILILLIFREKEAPESPSVLMPVTVVVSSPEDIVPLRDSLVAPIVYDSVHVLDELPIEIRKQKFVEIILPSILIVQHRNELSRERIRWIAAALGRRAEISEADSAFLNEMLIRYKSESTGELLDCLCPQPASIALAQAALESGWGTSRVFKIANNVFGIWSYNQNEDRIRAAASTEERTVFLRKYADIMHSVEDYFKVLNSGHAYSDYRKKRCETQNVYELIWYLRNYSEMRNQYVVMLRNMIAANDLTRYDRYRISPEYFHTPGKGSRGGYSE